MDSSSRYDSAGFATTPHRSRASNANKSQSSAGYHSTLRSIDEDIAMSGADPTADGTSQRLFSIPKGSNDSPRKHVSTKKPTDAERRTAVIRQVLADTQIRLNMKRAQHALDRLNAVEGTEEYAEAAFHERTVDDQAAASYDTSQYFGEHFAECIEGLPSDNWEEASKEIPIENVVFARDTVRWTIEAIRKVVEYLEPRSKTLGTRVTYETFCNSVQESMLADGEICKKALEGLGMYTDVIAFEPTKKATLADEDPVNLQKNSGFLRYKLESLKSRAEKIYEEWDVKRTFWRDERVKDKVTRRAISAWQKVCEETLETLDDAYWMSLFGSRFEEIIEAAKMDQLPGLSAMEEMSYRVLLQAEDPDVKQAIAEADTGEDELLGPNGEALDLQSKFDDTVKHLRTLHTAVSRALSRAKLREEAAAITRQSQLQWLE